MIYRKSKFGSTVGVNEYHEGIFTLNHSYRMYIINNVTGLWIGKFISIIVKVFQVFLRYSCREY